MRKEIRDEYVLPQGWLFNYISCPHYFGEIIEWGGWAVMTWSLPGLAFFIFTFANLFPQGNHSHKWYKAKFPGIPSGEESCDSIYYLIRQVHTSYVAKVNFKFPKYLTYYLESKNMKFIFASRNQFMNLMDDDPANILILNPDIEG